MRYSQQAVDLAKQFEADGGPKLVAYKPLPNDVWTIAFGHTKGVHEGMTCTPDDAVRFLKEDLNDAENCVNLRVKIGLTQEEFDALCDFVLNVGPTAFEYSTLLEKLNANDIEGAIGEFEKWDMSGGKVVAGLLRRRNAERALFTLGADFSGEAQPQPETQA
jgi:lysozyme